MATIEQIGEWIIANQDKQGTPEFETVANAYKELRAGSISGEAERLREEGEAELQDLLDKPIEEEVEEPGILDQGEEFIKGIFGGAVGLGESAALGAVTPFGEDTETAAREGILSATDPVREFFAADKGSEEIFGRKFGEALGSFLGIGATALVPVLGLPLAAGLAVSAGAGEASERARAGDATEGERGIASLLGGAVGATELISPLRIIKAFKKSIGDDVADDFFSRAKRIAKEAGVEGTQEFTAAFLQNAIEKGIYNPEKGLMDDALEQGGYGAGVGGFVQAVGDMIAPKFRKRTNADGNTEILQLTDQRGDQTISALDAETELEEQGRKLLEDRRPGPKLEEGQDQGELFEGLDLGLARQEPNFILVPEEGETTETAKSKVDDAPVQRDLIDELEDAQLKGLIDADETKEIRDLIAKDEETARVEAEKKLEQAKEAQLKDITKTLDAEQRRTTEIKRGDILRPILENLDTASRTNTEKRFSKALGDAGIADTTINAQEKAVIKLATDAVRDGRPIPAEAKDYQQIKTDDIYKGIDVEKGTRLQRTEIPDVDKKRKGSVLPETRKVETDDLQIEKLDETAARRGTEGAVQDVAETRPDDTTRSPEGFATFTPAGLDVSQRDTTRVGRREGKQQDTLTPVDKVTTEVTPDKELTKEKFNEIRQKRNDLSTRLTKVQQGNDRGKYSVITRELDTAVNNKDVTTADNALQRMEAFVADREKGVKKLTGDTRRKGARQKLKDDATVEGIGKALGKKTRTKTKPKKEPLVKPKETPKKVVVEDTKTKQIYGEKAFKELQKSPKKKRIESQLSKAINEGVQTYDVIIETDEKTGKRKNVLKKKEVKTRAGLLTEYVKNLRKPLSDYDSRTGIDLNNDGNILEESDLQKLQEIMAKGTGTQQTKEPLDIKAGRVFNKYAENVSRTSDVFVLAAHDSVFAEDFHRTKEIKTPELKKYFERTGKNRAKELLDWSRENLSKKANDAITKLIAIERSDYIKQRELRRNAAGGKWGEIATDKKLKANQKAEMEQFDEVKNNIKDKKQTLEDYMTTADEIIKADADYKITDEEIAAIADSEVIIVDKYLKADATEGLSLPLHPIIKNSLRAGDLKSALEGLQATSLNKETAQVAGKLAQKVGTTKVEIVNNLTDEGAIPVSGLFDPKTNTIKLDADTGFNPHVILHEMAHAVTSANLANKSHPTTKQLNALFNDVKDMLDTAYGSTNVDEFVAEAMSNPSFQAKLAGLNPNGKPINAFQRLVNIVGNFIRRITGQPTKEIDSALSRVDEVIDDIITPAPEFRSAGQLALVAQRPELLKTVKRIVSSTADVMDKNKYTSVVYDFLSSKAPKLLKSGVFISLPIQALGDLATRYNFKSPRVRELQKTIDLMNGETGQVDVAIDAAMRKYEPFFEKAINDGRKESFDFVVYQSTVFRVDPTKKRDEYKNKDGTARTDESGNDLLKKYDEIQKEWNKLGQEGQAIYNDMRRTYAKQYEKLKNVILGEIDNSDASTEVKQSLKKEVLAKLFDKNKIEPYFPLTREGDYWVSYQIKKGDSTEMAYEAFESNRGRERAMAELANDPDVSNVETYSTLDKVNFQNAPSGSFVKDVLQVMKVNKVDDVTQEQVLRMFIETLPATSFAKSFVKRKNSPGYKEDALGAFKEKGYDIGRQVVRMKYGKKLQEIDDGLAEDYKKLGNPKAKEYVLELQKRARLARNPPRDILMRASAQANRIAFLGTIGLNISSAIVNMTQVPLMFQPILGGKYGHRESFKAIKEAGVFIGSSGVGKKARKITTPNGEVVDVGAAWSIDNYYVADKDGKFKLRDDLNVDANKLRQLNRLLPLVQSASDRGQLNRSLFYDTLTLEEGGRARNLWDKINAFSAFFFHQQEKFNRQVALISTYNLELNRLENSTKASERNLSTAEKQELAANEALYRSQEMNGGASLANAPRIAQIPIGRVAMMYKSYGIQMYYTLIKTGLKAVGADKSLSPQEKKIAQKQFLGVCASSALLAGFQGMPFVGAVMFIINMLYDDEEESVEFRMNRFLGDHLYKGPISAEFTDISGRVGLSNLIFRNNPYNKDDSVLETIGKTLLGPAGSVIGQFGAGISEVTDEFGDTQRGIERMMPAAIRNIFKTGRYIADDGIYTRRGDLIVDDISGHGLFFQFLGFPPSEYTRAQEQNQVAKGIDKAVNVRRSKLLRQLYLELRHGMDTEDALDAISKFNKRHPKFAISADAMKRSIKQHIRQSATMHNGVSLSPKMRAYIRDEEDMYDYD